MTTEERLKEIMLRWLDTPNLESVSVHLPVSDLAWLIELVQKHRRVIEKKDQSILSAYGFTGDADCQQFLDEALAITVDNVGDHE